MNNAEVLQLQVNTSKEVKYTEEDLYKYIAEHHDEETVDIFIDAVCDCV